MNPLVNNSRVIIEICDADATGCSDGTTPAPVKVRPGGGRGEEGVQTGCMPGIGWVGVWTVVIRATAAIPMQHQHQRLAFSPIMCPSPHAWRSPREKLFVYTLFTVIIPPCMYRNIPQDGKIRIQQGLPSEKLKTAVAEAASYKVTGGTGAARGDVEERGEVVTLCAAENEGAWQSVHDAP